MGIGIRFLTHENSFGKTLTAVRYDSTHCTLVIFIFSRTFLSVWFCDALSILPDSLCFYFWFSGVICGRLSSDRGVCCRSPRIFRSSEHSTGRCIFVVPVSATLYHCSSQFILVGFLESSLQRRVIPVSWKLVLVLCTMKTGADVLEVGPYNTCTISEKTAPRECKFSNSMTILFPVRRRDEENNRRHRRGPPAEHPYHIIAERITAGWFNTKSLYLVLLASVWHLAVCLSVYCPPRNADTSTVWPTESVFVWWCVQPTYLPIDLHINYYDHNTSISV